MAAVSAALDISSGIPFKYNYIFLNIKEKVVDVFIIDTYKLFASKNN